MWFYIKKKKTERLHVCNTQEERNTGEGTRGTHRTLGLVRFPASATALLVFLQIWSALSLWRASCPLCFPHWSQWSDLLPANQREIVRQRWCAFTTVQVSPPPKEHLCSSLAAPQIWVTLSRLGHPWLVRTAGASVKILGIKILENRSAITIQNILAALFDLRNTFCGFSFVERITSLRLCTASV